MYIGFVFVLVVVSVEMEGFDFVFGVDEVYLFDFDVEYLFYGGVDIGFGCFGGDDKYVLVVFGEVGSFFGDVWGM